jgi:hypothetical protein
MLCIIITKYLTIKNMIDYMDGMDVSNKNISMWHPMEYLHQCKDWIEVLTFFIAWPILILFMLVFAYLAFYLLSYVFIFLSDVCMYFANCIDYIFNSIDNVLVYIKS